MMISVFFGVKCYLASHAHGCNKKEHKNKKEYTQECKLLILNASTTQDPRKIHFVRGEIHF
tara:strand:- start:3047 stop:3229 length:183 start_codon:yes stop_codon:yes gene_type:complete